MVVNKRMMELCSGKGLFSKLRYRCLSSVSHTSTWETMRERYRTDPQRILTYNDPLVHRLDGRVFKCDPHLLSIKDPLIFPNISGWNLNDDPVVVPKCASNNVKLIGLSLRGGFDYVKSWLDPFEEQFKSNPRVSISELCVHDYSFLQYLRSSFITNLKKEVPEENHARTVLSFGNTHEMAVSLLLPSKYTGYVYLVDKMHRVRWRSCGKAQEDEIATLIKCAKQLLVSDR